MNLAQRLALDLFTADLGELQQAAATPLLPAAQQARHMYNGHHLGKPIGNGETDLSYWRGPQFEASPDLDEQSRRQADQFLSEFQRAVRRTFTSTNFVRQVVRRELGSATSRMTWTIRDPQGQEGLSDLRTEADALSTAWWRMDRRLAERSTRAAIAYARREGRGVLRFRVAAAALIRDAAGVMRIKTQDMTQLLRYIQLEHVEAPESVGIWQNPDTLTRHAVYSYQDPAQNQAAEVSSELENGQTLLRVVKAEQPSQVTLNLGGRLTLIELTIEPLITEQVLQNQMAYNTASTMILRNTELAGFIERYGINIEPPFIMEPDPEHPGQMKRRYLPVKTGAGTMNLWRSSTYDQTDAQNNYSGETPLGSPSYGRFEPVSPEALTAASDHSRANIYSEVAQDYVLMASVGTESGRSREVAISDFEITREPVVDLGKTSLGLVLETFLALVSALAGQAGRFESLQVEGQVQTRVVPPSSLDRDADRADAQAGIISVQTARHRQGIDASEQEDAQVSAERAAGTSPTLTANAPPVQVPGSANAGA